MVFLEKKADPLFALQVSYQADQLKTFYICRCRRPRRQRTAAQGTNQNYPVLPCSSLSRQNAFTTLGSHPLRRSFSAWMATMAKMN
jgi:hypothetical protein